jgi:hypothetical protein
MHTYIRKILVSVSNLALFVRVVRHYDVRSSGIHSNSPPPLSDIHPLIRTHIEREREPPPSLDHTRVHTKERHKSMKSSCRTTGGMSRLSGLSFTPVHGPVTLTSKSGKSRQDWTVPRQNGFDDRTVDREGGGGGGEQTVQSQNSQRCSISNFCHCTAKNSNAPMI